MGNAPLPSNSAWLSDRSVIDTLPTITLVDLDAVAALQTRVDRKYLVEPELAEMLLIEFANSTATLMVDNERAFQYESVYFDSDDFRLYRDAATRRRRRYKVRTRSQGNGDAMLEVKAKNGRGLTVKSRTLHLEPTMTELGSDAADFVDKTTGVVDSVLGLGPVLTTCYQRTTLFHDRSSSRLTVDENVRCTNTTGTSASFRSIVIETKSARAASPFDRWLWSQGRRPVRLSKFSTALAALTPALPSNRWHRTINSDLLTIETA